MQEFDFCSLERNTVLLNGDSLPSSSLKERCIAIFSSISFNPTVLTAFSALLVFYSLYFFKSTTLTAIFFFLFFLSSVPSIIFIFINRISMGRFNNKSVIRKRHIHKKLASFFLFICLGIGIATFAYTKLLISLLAPSTLAQRQNVTKITASLLQDAYPAGSSYYRAKVLLLNCKYDDGSTYSCRGEVLLFIPSVFIKQNYRGNATLKKRGSEIEMFSKGLVIEVEGHFAKVKKKESYSMNRFVVSQNSDFKFKCWSSFISAYRAHARFYLNKLLYGWKEAGYLLQALLTANRDFLNVEDAKSFRSAGLSHILALSGMHLAIIGGLAHFFSSLFFGRKLIKFAILIICFLFLTFAGASPSLLRSFFMLCILATSRLLYVKVELLAVLAFTFLLHLFSFPQDALTLSFILSYSALFGILFFGESLYNLLTPFIPDFLCTSISASLGATFATIPFIAISFGQISIIGIVASCIISPLISSFLVLGISFIALAIMMPISYHLCGTILNLFYDTIITIVHIFALFPPIKCETKMHYALSFLPFLVGIAMVFFEKYWKKRKLSYLAIN